MKVIVSLEAAERLESQVRYLHEQNAHRAAETLRRRVTAFYARQLATSPRAGKRVPDRDLWETRIPKTKLIVWYRIKGEVLTVLTLWHASQDRFGHSKP